jgi:hypothetical protein
MSFNIDLCLTYGLKGAALVTLLLLWRVLYELIMVLRLHRRLMTRVDCMMDLSRLWKVFRGINWFSRKKTSDD